jgi:hypothetical protein
MGRKASRERVIRALLDRYGRTYCDELGIAIERYTPWPLFQWLCASILFSARISAELARRAARALIEQGWTSPLRMAETSWAERTAVLNRAGYARYDERTSRMLGDTAELLLRQYNGDLRKLRERAGYEPRVEHRLLKEFKGIGEVGADIFCREVQTVWDEVYPFADKKALAAAARLAVGNNATALAPLVERRDFPRLLAALVRTGLAKDYEGIIETASGEPAT